MIVQAVVGGKPLANCKNEVYPCQAVAEFGRPIPHPFRLFFDLNRVSETILPVLVRALTTQLAVDPPLLSSGITEGHPVGV